MKAPRGAVLATPGIKDVLLVLLYAAWCSVTFDRWALAEADKRLEM